MSKARSIGGRLAAVAAGFVGLALVVPASAIDLRDWGRKLPTSARFMVLSQFGNEAVLDKETQLIWQRTPSAETASWVNAKNACLQPLAGRLGWRLPYLHELASLAVPNKPTGSLALPAGHPFKNVAAGLYYTATRHVNDSGQVSPGFVYIVQFQAGGMFAVTPTNGSFFFWCVRGGGPIDQY